MKLSYLLPLLVSVLMTACSGDDVIESGQYEEQDDVTLEREYYQVSLDFCGEISVEQTPLSSSTRSDSSTDDVYGINVYYDEECDGEQDDIYGYGIFSDKSMMTISLLTGHVYKFVCTMVEDGMNTLYINSKGRIGYPFQIGRNTLTTISNEFICGTNYYLIGIGSGNTHTSSISTMTTSNYETCPSVSRYYGETSDYEPTEGGTVSIYLKRTSFGAKFNISGVEECTVTASCGSFWSISSISSDYEGSSTIYTFPDVEGCWADEDYSITETLSLSYTVERGYTTETSITESITFKRNVLTVVNMTVSPDLSSATFTFDEEEMDEDNIIEIDLDGDGVITVVVDPTE